MGEPEVEWEDRIASGPQGLSVMRSRYGAEVFQDSDLIDLGSEALSWLIQALQEAQAKLAERGEVGA